MFLRDKTLTVENETQCFQLFDANKEMCFPYSLKQNHEEFLRLLDSKLFHHETFYDENLESQ